MALIPTAVPGSLSGRQRTVKPRMCQADTASDAGQTCVKTLREACHGSGFCYLENYGIDPTAEKEVFDIAHRFFALPESDRLAIKNTKSAHFRGYTRLGMEVANKKQDCRHG